MGLPWDCRSGQGWCRGVFLGRQSYGSLMECLGNDVPKPHVWTGTIKEAHPWVDPGPNTRLHAMVHEQFGPERARSDALWSQGGLHVGQPETPRPRMGLRENQQETHGFATPNTMVFANSGATGCPVLNRGLESMQRV